MTQVFGPVIREMEVEKAGTEGEALSISAAQRQQLTGGDW